MSTFYLRLISTSVLLLSTLWSHAQFMKLVQTDASPVRWDIKAHKDGAILYSMLQSSELGTHSYLTRTSSTGNVIWSKRISQGVSGEYSNAGYADIAFDSEENWIIGGSVVVTSGEVAKGYVQKQDSLGNVEWVVTVDAQQSAFVSNVEVTDNVIYATISSYSFFSSTFFYKAGVVGISHEGVVLWHKKYAHPTSTTDYDFARTTVAPNGDFIGVADIRGSSPNHANAMMITRITPQGDIVFSKYYDFLTTHAQLAVNGLAVTDEDEIIFGGRLMPEESSIYPNSMWLAKLDADGIELVQKTYSAGEDTGELLSSLRYDNGHLYAGILVYAPFAELNRSALVAEIDQDNLSIIAYNALEHEVLFGDPYGQDHDSFDVGQNGNLVFAGGIYCAELNKSMPVVWNFLPTLSSGCEELERSINIIDEAANYSSLDYTPSTSITFTFGTQPSVQIENSDPFILADLCSGCDTQVNLVEYSAGSKSQISVYPNPATDEVFIATELSGAIDYSIRDIQGRCIVKDKFSQRTRVNTAGLLPGVYLIIVGNSITQRLLIQ